MLTCDEARELFSARTDDALTDAERADLEAHLARCPDCPRELARFEKTVSLLRAVAPARAPAGFVERVVAAARPTPWSVRWRGWLSQPLAWGRPLEATVLVLVAVTAVYLYERTPELRYGAAPVPSYPAPGVAGQTRAPSVRPPAAPAPAARPFAKEESADRATPPGPAAPLPRSAARQAEEPTARVATPPAAPAPSVDTLAREKLAERATSAPAAPETAKSAASAPSGPETEKPAARAPAAPAETDQRQGGLRDEPSRRARADTKLAAPAAKAARPADVVGRLVVGDRTQAERALAPLLARLDAAEIGRRVEADALVVEIVVAAAAYPELLAGLGRIGRWVAEPSTAELPARVRLVVRITD